MAAVNANNSDISGLDSPASNAAAVTTHDTNELTYVTRGLYIGGAGSVVVTIGGSDVTFSGVPAGTILPIRVTKVKTASTATLIVALW